MGRRMEALLAIVEEIRPATTRQSFYACVVRGIVQKTEAEYAKIQRALVHLRRSGDLDWDAIADHTRWMRKTRSFSRLEDAFATTTRAYRRDLWHDADAYVEVWIEKDALGTVFGTGRGGWRRRRCRRRSGAPG